MVDDECGTCDTDYNKVFYLEQLTPGGCVYRCIELDAACGANSSLTLTLYKDGSNTKMKVELDVWPSAVSTPHVWEKDLGTDPFDCCTKTSQVLTPQVNGDRCDSSNAYCVVFPQWPVDGEHYCPCQQCDGCFDGKNPRNFQLVIDGMAGPEADCPELNGTWVLSRDDMVRCAWGIGPLDFVVYAACDDQSEILLQILKTGGLAEIKVWFTWYQTTVCTWAGTPNFHHSQETDYDCLNLTDFALDRGTSPDTCDNSAASCLVTSL